MNAIPQTKVIDQGAVELSETSEKALLLRMGKLNLMEVGHCPPYITHPNVRGARVDLWGMSYSVSKLSHNFIFFADCS
jgi:hypothetical protein